MAPALAHTRGTGAPAAPNTGTQAARRASADHVDTMDSDSRNGETHLDGPVHVALAELTRPAVSAHSQGAGVARTVTRTERPRCDSATMGLSGACFRAMAVHDNFPLTRVS